MLAWQERPFETATLLNPVFTCLLMTQSCLAFEKESGCAMPIPFVYLVLPLVLHCETRKSMPRSMATHLSNWALGNKALRVGLPSRVNHLIPYTSEGLVLGFSLSILGLYSNARIGSGTIKLRNAFTHLTRFLNETTDEVRDCCKKSEFLGKWLSRAGDVVTVYQILGMAL